MSAPLRHSRNVFLTGLLALTPLVITVAVLSLTIRLINGFLSPLITWFLSPLLDSVVGRHVPGLGTLFGFVLTLVLIYLVGLVTTNLLGQKLVDAGERLLTRLPIIKGIYNGSKQLVDAVSLPAKGAFNTVVLVEYPRRGMYMVGFITRPASGTIKDADRLERLNNVFIPNTPNPTSGRFVMVPDRDLIPVSISVEEGLKLIISGGFVSPAAIRSIRPLPDREGATYPA